MKTFNKIKKNICIALAIVLLLCCKSTLKAQTIYLITDLGNIYSLNVSSCVSTLVTTPGDVWLDIAICPGNPSIIYALKDPGDLYQINISTGITTLIGPFYNLFPTQVINALVCDGNGMLYAAGNNFSALYEFNLSLNTWTYLGGLNGFISGGDLTFYNGTLLMSTDNNQLVQVSTNPVGAAFLANISVPDVWGVIAVGSGTSCNPSYTLLGTSVSSLYTINPVNGDAILLCNNFIPTGETVNGAASVVEGNTSVQSASITGNDIICTGQNTILTAAGGTVVNWNTGETTTTITVNPTATTAYTVYLTNGQGCNDTATKTITVNAFPIASLSGNSTICRGSSTTLTASGGGTYQWNTGETSSTLTTSPLSNSIGSVIVSNGNCSDTAFINITVKNSPTADAGTDVTTLKGVSTQLYATGIGIYNWSPVTGLSCTNCPNPIASALVTTDYCVTITDTNGCYDNDCVRVIIDLQCPSLEKFTIPNAFSPNNDGHNDFFLIQGFGNCLASFSLIIFDRWGEKVFETKNVNTSWDGSFKGKSMDTAVFVYSLDISLITGEKTIKKGNISLIR